MLALLAVAVQGAWGQTNELTLYDGSNNSSTITSSNGTTGNVAIIGRTLYRDGYWNTLCLPFNMSDEQIAESQLAGTVIKKLDGKNSNLTNGVLTLKFNTATEIEAGTPYIVKWITINTKADWDKMVTDISEGKSYSGKIVQLGADITVTTSDMMGPSPASTTNAFDGIFDGNGHTITCDINATSLTGAAPFLCINNATIKNLKVTGSVHGGNHCAGLVGYAFGINTITNCEVDVNVACSASGANTHCGGILGNGTESTTTISNCLFSGSLTGSTSTTGIIYGWGETNGTQNIDHCLANANYTYVNSLDIIMGDGTKSASACYMNVGSSNYATELDAQFGTDESATSAYVSYLGASDWEMVTYQEDETTKYKVVPKMTTISNITSPEFNNVTIDKTIRDVTFTGGTFKGNYDALTINDSNRDEILLFAAGNKLGYANTNRTLNAFRAYFEIPTTKGAQAVRSFVLDFGDEDSTLGIMDAEADSSLFTHHSSLSGWYTLDGLRLDGKPTTKGIYVNNGKKVVIK